MRTIKTLLVFAWVLYALALAIWVAERIKQAPYADTGYSGPRLWRYEFIAFNATDWIFWGVVTIGTALTLAAYRLHKSDSR